MKNILTVLLLALSVRGSAQTIKGVVIDENAHPISFVAVSDIQKHSGSYTNDEGVFVIDTTAAPTDEILFSHIGYVDIRMSVKDIANLKGPIQLQPKNYSLQEIVVGPGNAQGILMDALSQIQDNYPTDFSKNHVIYKDYHKVNNNASLYYFFDYNMYLPSYLAKDSSHLYTTAIKHDMYTRNENIRSVESASPNHLIKQMYPEKIFDPNELIKDGFKLLSTTEMIDSEEYNVVAFKHKPPPIMKGIVMEGEAYINKKDKGIRFVNLHIYSTKASRVMLIAKVDTVNYLQKIAFKKIAGKYVLDYMTTTLFGRGMLFKTAIKVEQIKTIRIADRKMKLNANEIEMKTEIDDILLHEKPKNIADLPADPDMK